MASDIGFGPRELAKYPFLADAARYLRDWGFTLEQLGRDPDLRTIRENAFTRIQAAVQEGKIYKRTAVDIPASDLPLEVLSFLLAVVLLKLSRAWNLIKKFSLQEARRAELFLEKDLKKSTTDTEKVATKIIRDLSGVHVSKNDEYFIISVPDYLRRAVLFHAREWKLVNRRVESGMVFLTPHEAVRLIRQELVNYITTKINAAATPKMVPELREFVDELVTLNMKFQPRAVATTEFPPCIKHAINTLKEGENLPHSGRFMLATYLLTRGFSISDIIPYFKNAPDYNPSITEYQIKHLAGQYGGSKYRCQSCDKLRSLDLCRAIPECAGINNPTQFGLR